MHISAVGGVNIVKYDRGAANLTVQSNNFSGELDLGPGIAMQDIYWQVNSWGDLTMKIRGDNADTVNILGDLHLADGVVTSAVKTLKFSDGTVVDMTHGPSTFTWIGSAGYSVTGSNLGANTFELNGGVETITGGNNGNNT